MKTLIILESPSKIKSFQKILGTKNYDIVATCGHIKNIADTGEDNMGIDINNNFTPDFTYISSKQNIINNIIKSAINKNIILANDNDREGELIGYHVSELLNIEYPKKIIFNSITKTEITNAIINPIDLNRNVVNSTITRHILDKLFGYKLCKVLFKYIKNNISTGRVQAPVLKFIIDREVEVNKYIPVLKYDINAKLILDNNTIINCILNKGFKTSKKVYKILNKIKDVNKFHIINIEKKICIEKPKLPFKTTTLQREGYNKLKISPKTTMSICQKLYESGHITYIRTNSTNISSDSHNDIKQFIIDNYTEDYYSCNNNKINDSSPHEAIRVTNVNTILPDNKIYKLIYDRTIASFMKPAIYDIIVVYIKCEPLDDNKYYFINTNKILKFDGFKKIYNYTLNNNDNLININNTTKIIGYNEIIGICNPKKPQSHYNNSTIIKQMEFTKLSTPSVYVSIIEKLKKNNYIIETDTDPIKLLTGEDFILKDNNINIISKDIIHNEKNVLIPTKLGFIVNDFIVKYFGIITDYKFTSHIELELEKIANNEVNYISVIQDFYNILEPKILQLLKENKSKIDHDSLIGICPDTNKNIYLTVTRYGYVVRRGEKTDKDNKYININNNLINSITLENAIFLLSLPIIIPDSDNTYLYYGKYGFYIKKNNGKTLSIKDIDINNIDYTKIKKIISVNNNNIYINKYNITIYKGKYGSYTKYNNININIPNKIDIETLNNKIIISLYKKKNKKK